MTYTVSHNALKPSVDIGNKRYSFVHNHPSISEMAKGNLDMVALDLQLEKLEQCRHVLQERKAAAMNPLAMVACDDQISNDNQLINIIAAKRFDLFRR